MLLLYVYLSAAPAQAPREAGLRVSLLLDTSSSMKQLDRNVRAVGVNIANGLGTNDLGSVMTFAGKVELVQKFTSDHEELVEAIQRIPKARGTSSLRNALFVALKNGAGAGPHAIVVVSDGDDTSSRVSEDQVEELAATAKAQIFAVLLPGRKNPYSGNSRFLASLAKATEGRVWEPRDTRELESACEALTQELKRLSSIE